MRVHNFSAGPATLPLSVLDQMKSELLDYRGTGMSVIEMSHRSGPFLEIHRTAKQNIIDLCGLTSDFEVLFLQGGASLQFSMVPINFLRKQTLPAHYVLTGSWAKKAIVEAQREGTVVTSWSGADENFRRVPSVEEFNLEPSAYLHYTSNETIQGVQFRPIPTFDGVSVICDASSDIFSRPLPIERFSMVYGGAQKNSGPSGVTIVIISKELLERAPRDTHTMLNYRSFAENDSLYNTPSTYGIYVVMLVTQWLKESIGGLDQMQALNDKKAQLLYDEIDQSGGYYSGHSEPRSRSVMNVTWRLPSEALEKKFCTEAAGADLVGLKGHRSVGGMRASIYNAMTLDGVTVLREFMRDFQRSNG